MSADEDQLRILQLPGDTCHDLRAMPAKHHQPGWARGVQAKLDPLGSAVQLYRAVEIRPDDHSRCGVKAGRRVTGDSCLFQRLRRAANQVLLLPRLDPEIWRMIRQIRENGDVLHAGKCADYRFIQDAVEIGDQRDHEVGRRSKPVAT